MTVGEDGKCREGQSPSLLVHTTDPKETLGESFGPWMLVDRKGKKQVSKGQTNGPYNGTHGKGGQKPRMATVSKVNGHKPSTSTQVGKERCQKGGANLYQTNVFEGHTEQGNPCDGLKSSIINARGGTVSTSPNPFASLQTLDHISEDVSCIPPQNVYNEEVVEEKSSKVLKPTSGNALIKPHFHPPEPGHLSPPSPGFLSIPTILPINLVLSDHGSPRCDPAPGELQSNVDCDNLESEATHLIATEWWIEEAWVKIDLNMMSYETSNHSILIGSTRAMVNNRLRVRKILGTPDFSLLPQYPNSSSMKMLVWNRRGAGNSVFKRNLRELLKCHNPFVIVLMETKFQLSSMGLFFNNLGFTASTYVDQVGKCGGI